MYLTTLLFVEYFFLFLSILEKEPRRGVPKPIGETPHFPLQEKVVEESNLYESRLDFYSLKKLAASHRPPGQFSSLSVKSHFKGADVCLKLVSQASLLAYSAPENTTMAPQ